MARSGAILVHRRYEPGAVLGRGAQGIVLRVADREQPAKQLVAKVWSSQVFDERALAGEFALLARLHVRGLARAHDLGRDERTGAPFLVEDFVDGVDAASWIDAGGPGAKNARLLGVLADAAATLAALHEAGFAHADIKPAHVRVVLSGEPHAVLLDLGAAVSRARTDSAAGGFTRAYAAPEVLAGSPASAASDLFGLGALAWALATKLAPPQGARPPLRDLAPWVQPSAAEVIEALLALHPSDRPADAREVLRRLGAAGVVPRHLPAPIGRERELEALLVASEGGVRYVTGPSGAGKSQLVREVVTRALLAGRDARLIPFPCDDAQLVARLIAFFRGAEDAWPFVSRSALVVLDDLHDAPAELAAALDAYRCRGARGADVLASHRSAPEGAEAVELEPLGDAPFAELCGALGVDDVAAAARASGKNPGWLVAAAGRVPATRDTVLERVRALSRPAAELLGAIAICGGTVTSAFSATFSKGLERASVAELLAGSLLTRQAPRGAVVYALSASSLAGEIAAALASFELSDRVADALLDDPAAGARALLSAAQSPSPPARREDLLEQAAARARAQGLRTEEIESLFALAANPRRRTTELLCRLERLARDAGTAAHPEVLAWLDEAAKHDPRVSPLALRRRAEKAARDGDGAGARATADRAIEAARALGDLVAEALALSTAGAVALYRADWSAADGLLREARARLASLDVHDAEEIARLEHNAGVVALYGGRVDEAVLAFDRSLVAKRRLGDRAGMRSCLLNLGIAHAKASRFDDAVRALDEATRLARSLGQASGRAWCLGARADVEVRRKDAAAADRWIAEAEALGSALPPMVRADLVLLRAEVALMHGDGKLALDSVARLDAALRASDAMIDVRAQVTEASAHLATLPAAPRRSARIAVAAIRRARAASLPEQEAQAVLALRAARSQGRWSAVMIGGGSGGGTPSGYAHGMGQDVAAWGWLRAVAGGLAGADAAALLARVVATESHAERAFVAALEPSGRVREAWCVDLDGMPLDDAGRRLDAALVRTALGARGPVYQRDVETPGGRGSRIAIASPASADGGESPRAVIVAEHRFRSGHFDAVSEAAAERWATLGAVALRLGARGATWSSVAEEHVTDATFVAAERSERRPHAATTAIPLLEARRSFPTIMGSAPALRKALARLDAAIDSALPVLVMGDTGVGKEVFTRALHDHGPRARGPFVAVNCGAIPDALFEAEVFGHARGSFTGAERARPGLIARAEGGTLLLDEIGELPLLRQAVLLRALESRRYRPVGSDEERPFDVRIVAATNRDLERAVAEGTFRRDLLFRLNVIEIEVPSLQERPEDIPLLARAFLERAGSRAEISEDAMAALIAYAWPGNVRELEHQMQRLSAMRVDLVTVEHLPREARLAAPAKKKRRAPAQSERQELEETLARTAGNISHAAKELGLTRHGLKKRMVRLGMRG